MTDLDTLTFRANKRQRELDAQLGAATALVSRIKALRVEVSDLDNEATITEQAAHLLNTISEEKQNQAQRDIEELVTRGLQTIFDDTLSFHIIQTVKARTASVEFIVRTTLPDTVIDTPVMDSRGGGLAVTIGFLLRVVVMLLQGGSQKEHFLVLDETFAMVSAEYVPALGDFLRAIRNETGIQILMVTHQPEFAAYADRVYRFTQVGGRTVVTED